MTAALAAPAAPVAEWSAPDLWDYVGGLSEPSKMPGFAYSLPAAECVTGSRLRAVDGTTCSDCYAFKGRYRFGTVLQAQYRRLATIDRPLWADVMAELINRRADPARAARGWAVHSHFRWHDAGDLQGVRHLERIARVAELTPEVRHWLPTREYRMVRDYFAGGGSVPPNLTVRMSAARIGGAVPTFARLPVAVSTVTPAGDPPPPEAHRCPAPLQGNSCGDCRACWDPAVRLVDYCQH